MPEEHLLKARQSVACEIPFTLETSVARSLRWSIPEGQVSRAFKVCRRGTLRPCARPNKWELAWRIRQSSQNARGRRPGLLHQSGAICLLKRIEKRAPIKRRVPVTGAFCFAAPSINPAPTRGSLTRTKGNHRRSPAWFRPSSRMTGLR